MAHRRPHRPASAAVPASMRHRLLALALAVTLTVTTAGTALAASRIKDIVDIEGVRSNMLVGYGLVVGLNGTGDSISGSPFTEQSLIGMLERLGINTRGDNMKTNNVAAVMVTATLPAFTRQGSSIDVTVSSLGDADSLLGGTLLVTPLLGADGEVYAVAQGSVSVGGFSVGGEAENVTQGVPTAGRIPSGAIVEREIAFELSDLTEIDLALRNPDFTTARRIQDAINRYTGAGLATALDPATVRLTVPASLAGDVVGLITEIEQLEIVPDQPARVVVDERTGIIVMGENVRISTVAVAQGNLTVRITETPQVSQPGPLSQGTTVTVPRTQVEVDTGDGRQLGVVQGGLTLQELVQSLNALGIGPRDMISILQTISAAGALQADLEVL
ncbi:MAG: flagellar basal body P-ring protein FlgI [Rhodospirillaceae bacterium]|nr:flagellar basal body P-ring protein FlgI [Rhodospirillaceae bacterium]